MGPDAFSLIDGIPEVDADAFRRIKFQRGNLSIWCCRWEVQPEATTIRIVGLLGLNLKLSAWRRQKHYKMSHNLNLSREVSVWFWGVGVCIEGPINPICPLRVGDNIISNGRQVCQQLKWIFLVYASPTYEGSSGDVLSQIVVEGVGVAFACHPCHVVGGNRAYWDLWKPLGGENVDNKPKY